MREAVIVSAVRLPTGRFLGTLKDFQAPELGALVVREAVRRAGIDPATVDAVFVSHGDFYAATVVARLGVEALVRAGCACYTTDEEVARLVTAVERIAGERG